MYSEVRKCGYWMPENRGTLGLNAGVNGDAVGHMCLRISGSWARSSVVRAVGS